MECEIKAVMAGSVAAHSGSTNIGTFMGGFKI